MPSISLLVCALCCIIRHRGRQGANEELAEIARACTVKSTNVDPVFELIKLDFDRISFDINPKCLKRVRFNIGAYLGIRERTSG